MVRLKCGWIFSYDLNTSLVLVKNENQPTFDEIK